MHMTYRVETQVGVLDKTMAILQAFSGGNDALNPRDIAGRTAISLPTVYRLAHALENHGLLKKEGERFKLGVALMHLGAGSSGHRAATRDLASPRVVERTYG